MAASCIRIKQDTDTKLALFTISFVAILRFTAAWLAGISHMPWWRFLLWNAAGGICWATLVGLVAYYAGQAAADAINRYGLYGGVAVVGGIVLVLAGVHLWRDRAGPRR